LGKEIRLHPTTDGAEQYLAAEVSGDYEGLLLLVTGKNKFGGGQVNQPSLDLSSALKFKELRPQLRLRTKFRLAARVERNRSM